MEKSYVTLAQKICIVCGGVYNTNEILLDRRLRKQFDMHTVVGYGMCPEHQKMKDDGYVALVAVDPSKVKLTNDKEGNAVVKGADQVYRLGPLAFLKNEAFDAVMNVKRPENGVCFVHPEVIEMLQQSQTDADLTPEVNDGQQG